ncbi:hypothetical protein [Paenibacillus marinisediminis]
MTQPKSPNGRRNKRHRTRPEANRQYETEAAYELTAPASTYHRTAEVEKEEQVKPVSGLAILAVVFAIGSLFLAPIIMGPTSAVLGAMVYVQGDRAAGLAAIVIGVAAFTIRLLSVII